MLDFENTKIPVPLCYDKFLTIEFGDWHKFVKGGGKHEVQAFSADIPYKEMLQKMINRFNIGVLPRLNLKPS